MGEAVEALPGQANDALRLKPAAGSITGITVSDGVCYLAGSGGGLASWVPGEATPRWTAQLGATPSTAPVVDGAQVLVGLRSGALLALAGEVR